MCQVHVARQRPCSRKLVSQLGVAAVLFEAHVGAVAVGAVVGAGDDAREASLADTVRQLGLQRVVGAVGGLQVGADALLALLARDDVDDAAHGVGTVEYRGGAALVFSISLYWFAGKSALLIASINFSENPASFNVLFNDFIFFEELMEY